MNTSKYPTLEKLSHISDAKELETAVRNLPPKDWEALAKELSEFSQAIVEAFTQFRWSIELILPQLMAQITEMFQSMGEALAEVDWEATFANIIATTDLILLSEDMKDTIKEKAKPEEGTDSPNIIIFGDMESDGDD